MERAPFANAEALVESVAPIVRAILMRKSGMTLAADDERADNVDALDLLQDVLARLWERVAGAGTEAFGDFRGYAAMVAYNAWSDHLRSRYPERASLKNSLRYFLGHQPKYALWESREHGTLCGPQAWQVAAREPNGAALGALLNGHARLPAGSVPRKERDRYGAADWDCLLTAVFALAGGPIEIDDLVSVLMRALGLAEPKRIEPRRTLDERDDALPEVEAADVAPTPEELADLREQLAILWRLIVALRLDWRQPYLLNPPGADGQRGEIDVFVAHGIARLTDLERAFELTGAHYESLWRALDLATEDRVELASLAAPIEHFAMLYKYLPLADALIGELMGLAAQQVVNRRNSALASLRKSLQERG